MVSSVLNRLILAFSISLLSCSCTLKKHDIKDDENALSWMNIYTKTWENLQFGDEEEKVDFLIIPDDQKNIYIKHLEHMSYYLLEKDEYFKLTGKELKKKYGLAIRAVYPHLGGNFSVIRNNNNEYLVFYHVMGSGVWQRKKAVLIIEAEELPKKIFIEYYVIK